MIKCLFSDHLAKVKSRKPVECQATHVLFLRVGSLCLSWFLSSPAGEASSVNMDTASSLSSILIAASALKWGLLLIDSVLALEMFTTSASSSPLCWPWSDSVSVRQWKEWCWGRWISRAAFQIASIPWEMLRKMLVWTACSSLWHICSLDDCVLISSAYSKATVLFPHFQILE